MRRSRLWFVVIYILLSILAFGKQVQAQSPSQDQNVSCSGFELKNADTNQVLTSGNTVTAGTKISYKPVGCTEGWVFGTRLGIVTNNNAFPTDHIQCANRGNICITYATYGGTGSRMYFRSNLLALISNTERICRHTGGWDSIPVGMSAPQGYSCGLADGKAYAYLNVVEATENPRSCYTAADHCTTYTQQNCNNSGSKYQFKDCLKSLLGTACKINDQDYIVAVPNLAMGKYENSGGSEFYTANVAVYKSSSNVQNFEFRGLSFYCPEGPIDCSGGCAQNRIDLPPGGQSDYRHDFGTRNSLTFQMVRPVGNHCGAFELGPYFTKVNGQVCQTETGTSAYSVCNTLNPNQNCGLPADWKTSCTGPTPTPCWGPLPSPNLSPTLPQTPTPTSSLPSLCVSITASKTPIAYGDKVTFTCGLVPSAASYEFRVIAPDGSIKYVPTDHQNVSGEYTATGDQSGRYVAQCRVCPNPTICSSDRNYGWNSPP